MVNAKLNTRIIDVFFNGETPMLLNVGDFNREIPTFLPMVLPLACAYYLAEVLIISTLVFAIGASIIILLYTSQVILLKIPHYLIINVKNFQKI